MQQISSSHEQQSMQPAMAIQSYLYQHQRRWRDNGIV